MCEVFLNHVDEDSWYNDFTYILQHGSFPLHMNPKCRRALRLKYAQYTMINGILFHNNHDGVLLKYVER